MKIVKKTNFKPLIKTRKDKRKEKRQQKKLNRVKYRQNAKDKKQNIGLKNGKDKHKKEISKQSKEETVDDDEEILSDFSSDVEGNVVPVQKPSKTKLLPIKKVVEEKKSTQELMWLKEKTREEKLKKDMSKQKIKQLKSANDDDDKLIRNLEKKLKIDRSKSKKKKVPTMFNDGLDYLLELCEPDNMNKIFSESKKRILIGECEGVDDLDEDFADIVGNKKARYDEDSEHEDADGFDDQSDDGDDYSENQNDEDFEDHSDDGDENVEDDDDNDDGDNNSNDSFGSDSEDRNNQVDMNDDSPLKARTDIYGRTLDESGKVVQADKGKYIPPHLKNIQGSENAKVIKLKRQLKGNINRLAEANLSKIAKEIDALYMENSRNDMNSTLTSLISEALVTNILSSERSVLEHLLLLSVLHANVGCEVGANFLEKIVERFDNEFKTIDNENVENKSLDNVVQIICHLYTFKIIQHSLIYEIIEKLQMNLNEKSVECILLILRSIGFTLRKDDPIALKTLINSVQKIAHESAVDVEQNSRLKYMLDVLLAIKNNNMKKIPQYDPSMAEHFKKLLKGMCMNGKYVTTLNITLSDLLNVEQRGKWWIVGSAWTGSDSIKKNMEMEKKPSSSAKSFSQTLLELARKQRMNTDEKKNIFCTIMSAEDYLDAFEKLMHLNVKDNNILVSIILHCCVSEKDYNPYYSILLQKFCDYDRKYQLATKFSCWDKIRNIQDMTNTQISNMAKFIIYLIQNGGLALSVLKIIEFSELDKFSLRLMRKTVIGILLSGEDKFKEIFQRIAPSTQLNSFKESMRLFMQHFLAKATKRSGLTEKESTLLDKRIKMADELLANTRSWVK